MTRCLSDLGRVAVAIARGGRPVFPLAVAAKTPARGSHGHLDATADPEAVRRAWQAAPRANVGLITGPLSRIWVLDVDPRHGDDRTLAELEDPHGPLLATIEAATPSGGRHLHWRWPEVGPEIRSTAGQVGAGLNMRGDGGFIVAPPSRLADGRRYRWAQPKRPLAAAPEWLLCLAAPPPPPRPVHSVGPPPVGCERYVANAIISELRRLDSASYGNRNHQLNSASFAIGQFVGCGAVPEDWARIQLLSRALGVGLPTREAEVTIASGLRAGMARPRQLPRHVR